VKPSRCGCGGSFEHYDLADAKNGQAHLFNRNNRIVRQFKNGHIQISLGAMGDYEFLRVSNSTVFLTEA
jgi:hypothetical protein